MSFTGLFLPASVRALCVRALCVRALCAAALCALATGPASADAPFVDHGDGTVTDTSTGLLQAVVVPHLRADDYTGAVTARTVLVTGTAGNGQPHRYLVTDRPEVTFMTVEIPPGAETGWHLHSVPLYAYLLAGRLEVALADGTTLQFKAGDAIVEVQDLAHNGTNRGSETVRLLAVYTGETGRPNVTRVAAPRQATP